MSAIYVHAAALSADPGCGTDEADLAIRDQDDGDDRVGQSVKGGWCSGQ